MALINRLKRIAAIGLVMVDAAYLQASTEIAVLADQDALVATGVENALVANNYGGAGATSVAGASTARAEQRTITRFDLAAAKVSFDAEFGAGKWRVDSIALRLNTTVPGGANPVFNNPNVAGLFTVDWIPADTWEEGTGTPNSPATDGVTWNLLATLTGGAENLGNQPFSGDAGPATYTLTPSTGLLDDVRTGAKASFMIRAIDATMSMVVHSRTFTTATNRPVLTIAASPVPAITTSAIQVTSRTATLTGLIQTGSSSVTTSFQYGETSGLGSTIAASPVSVGALSSVAVSAALTGLSPLTTYYYRVVSSDGVTTSYGEHGTFTTLGAQKIAVELLDGTALTGGVSSVAFGSPYTLQTVRRTLRIRNVGGEDLTIGDLTVTGVTTGGAFLAGALASTTLTPGANATLDIDFDSTAYGTKTGQLSIGSDDPDVPLFTLQLTAAVQNTPPVIFDVPDLGINPGGNTGVIVVRVGDVDTPVDQLVLTATSNNPILVPVAGILIGPGADVASRHVLITPVVGQTGQATITLSVSDGNASSSDTFVLDVTSDLVAPVLKITAPTLNGLVAEGAAVLTGTATDNLGLTALRVEIDGVARPEIPLQGASVAFSLPLSLVGGTHTLVARAVDGRGRMSAPVSRTFTYVVMRTLTLDVAGHGSIAKPYTGTYPQSAQVQMGKLSAVTAVPEPGYVFSRWTSSNPADTGINLYTQERTTLTFTPRTEMTLTAIFVPDPSPSIAGAYDGLIHALRVSGAGDTKPGVDTEGALSITVSKTGTFTGSLWIDGVKAALSGRFHPSGEARFGPKNDLSFSLIRANKPVIQLSLLTDVNAPGVITGQLVQLSRGTAVASSLLTANRRGFDGKTTLVPGDYLTVSGTKTSDGIFTMILPPKPETSQPEGLTISDYPQGHGVGTVKVGKAGLVSVSAVLADGVAFTASGALSAGLSCPLFVQLYSRAGFFSTQIQFDKNMADSDASAVETLWARPVMGGQWYPDGWPEVIKTDLLCARYRVPAGTSVIPGLLTTTNNAIANATLNCTGGNMVQPATAAFIVTPADVTTSTDASASLIIKRDTGLFSGWFTGLTPGSVKTLPKYRGVIYQKGVHTGGYGFFQTTKPAIVDGTGQTGDVMLNAKRSLP